MVSRPHRIDWKAWTSIQLFEELARRGWSEVDMATLAGGNILRVLKQNEEVARRLQASTPASSAMFKRAKG